MKHLVSFLGLVVLCGCASTVQREIENKKYMADRLNCSVETTTITNSDSTTRVASGCGRSEIYVQEGPYLLPVPDLAKRASFELDCQPSKLVFTILSGPRQQGVAGCGKKAVYMVVRTAEHKWDWAMDSVKN